jgi:nicotinate dehydrogenase subunit B
MTAQLPRSLEENPLMSQWVDFSRPGTARVFSAKVEIGQGILTALAQIAADELRLPLEQVQVVSGDTAQCPVESYTAGSMSIEVGAMSLRLACAQAREELIERAARMMEVESARVSLQDGRVLLDGRPSELDYWKVAPHVEWRRPVTGRAAPIAVGAGRYVGRNVARLDLPAKIAGGGFIHDLEMPGLLHARVLRPPSYGARLEALDESAAAALPGVVKIWRSGDFAAVVCEREYQAVKALEALRKGAQWREPEPGPAVHSWSQALPAMPTSDSSSEFGPPASPAAAGRHISASYTRPLLAHASMGPSCAIACFQDDCLRIWSHTQGVFPLRKALATALGLAEAQVIVTHVQGAGVYGHNGADDAAMDAALLARQLPSRPVRVQWSREDELLWSPFGSPMVVKMEGEVGAAGEIAGWTMDIWSGPHGLRPSAFGGVNLLGAAQMEPAIAPLDLHRLPTAFGGAERNSQAPYQIAQKITLHRVADLPVRVSSLRTLGGFANVFAIESFMDELALAADADPLEFRLRHLMDPRARRVIETAARLAGWKSKSQRGSGRACGMGFSRYKTTAAYVAAIAEVEAGRDVRVTRVWCAVDAGLVINPDGVINQIEGGVVQSISWTLKEQVGFDGRVATTHSWDDYPILRFTEVPEIAVELITNTASPALGVGEAAQGPAAAAIANAVACALDLRIRELPITRERIIATA